MHWYACSVKYCKVVKKNNNKNETYNTIKVWFNYLLYIYIRKLDLPTKGDGPVRILNFFMMYTFYLYIIYLGLNKYYVLRVTGPNLQKCPIQPFSDICLFLSECDFHIIFIKNLFLLRILYLCWCSRAEKKYDLKQILNSNLFHKCYSKHTFFLLGPFYNKKKKERMLHADWFLRFLYSPSTLKTVLCACPFQLIWYPSDSSLADKRRF